MENDRYLPKNQVVICLGEIKAMYGFAKKKRYVFPFSAGQWRLVIKPLSVDYVVTGINWLK